MQIPENLRIGRRAIDSFKECELIKDWTKIQDSDAWYFEFSVTSKTKGDFPETTNWVLVTNGNYPKGSIEVYPSIRNGITDTFFHQSNNGKKYENRPWRTGKLCLEVLGVREGIVVDNKPKSEYGKIRWYIKRTIEWVKKAASNTLIESGQWMELPEFQTSYATKLIFSEDLSTADNWTNTNYDYGMVDLYELTDSKLLIKDFCSIDGSEIVSYSWGYSIKERIPTLDSIRGMWIKFNDVPVINGWQAPNNWKELREACEKQGIKLMEILKELAPKIRDERRHFLLLGFPFQPRIGGKNRIYQWKAIHLPPMSSGENFAKGFRKYEKGWFYNDLLTIYGDNVKVNWTYESNWSPHSALLRGRYNNKVTQKRYLLIGAGTLGSYISEQLVRNGVEDITILDKDFYEIGNNCRHILRFDDVYSKKSKSLARALNDINPHARVKAQYDKLSEKSVELINHFDVIIDCSANDDVISLIARNNESCAGKFISASFSFNAETLYLYCCETKKLIYEEYTDFLSQIDNTGKNKYIVDDLPQDGIGCWSPAFPAFASDVLLAASTSVPIITKYIENDSAETRGFIYKKKYTEDGFLIGYEQTDGLYK